MLNYSNRPQNGYGHCRVGINLFLPLKIESQLSSLLHVTILTELPVHSYKKYSHIQLANLVDKKRRASYLPDEAAVVHVQSVQIN
jgi:hypothetical protein